MYRNISNEFATQSAIYDAEFTTLANTFQREGYAFVGWGTNPNATEASDIVAESTAITLKSENVNYYAIWQGRPMQVAYNLSGLREHGQEVQPENIQTRYGNQIVLPELYNVTNAENANLAFVGFNVNGKIYASGTAVAVEADDDSLVITPVWAEKNTSRLYVKVTNPETGVSEQLVYEVTGANNNYTYRLATLTDTVYNQTLTQYVQTMGLNYYDFEGIFFEKDVYCYVNIILVYNIGNQGIIGILFDLL